MTTKTIRLRKDVADELTEYANGISLNKAMRELLDGVEPSDNVRKCVKEYTNIHIDEDLVDKLHKCRKYSSDTHSDVIARLLDESKK